LCHGAGHEAIAHDRERPIPECGEVHTSLRKKPGMGMGFEL